MVASWQGTVQASHAALEKKLAESGFAGQVGHVDPGTLNVAALPLDKVLTAKEREITELGVGQLLARLSKGELKAEDVTVSGGGPTSITRLALGHTCINSRLTLRSWAQRAFCHRAVIAHELVSRPLSPSSLRTHGLPTCCQTRMQPSLTLALDHRTDQLLDRHLF